jgi:hypothetical protein
LTARKIKYFHKLCKRDETLDEVTQCVVQKQSREASLESKSQLDNGFFGLASYTLGSVYCPLVADTLGSGDRAASSWRV